MCWWVEDTRRKTGSFVGVSLRDCFGVEGFGGLSLRVRWVAIETTRRIIPGRLDRFSAWATLGTFAATTCTSLIGKLLGIECVLVSAGGGGEGASTSGGGNTCSGDVALVSFELEGGIVLLLLTSSSSLLLVSHSRSWPLDTDSAIELFDWLISEERVMGTSEL